LICEPLSVKASPAALRGTNGRALAQFSLPYVLACALARRQVTTEELFIEARTDPTLLDVLAKIHVVMDDTTRGLAELPEPGQVEVDLCSGVQLERTVRRAVGHPDRPMTEADQIAKFQWCARALSPTRADRIVAAVLGVDESDDLGELTDALYGAP
jgi:2-methylcitrate dehydratase PrpD